MTKFKVEMLKNGRLGSSLSQKPKQRSLGDRNTEEYNFILIWKIYGPNFICIHQIYKQRMGLERIPPDKMKTNL